MPDSEELRFFPPHLAAAAARLLDRCGTAGGRLVTAESCTGGLVAAALSAVTGTGQGLERGFVTYTPEAKSELLGVPLPLIEARGAVSAQVAAAMAEGALARSRAQIAIAVTGLAGPGGGGEGEPVGTVYVAVRARSGHHHVRRFAFGDIGRTHVQERAILAAFDMVGALLDRRSCDAA